MYVLPYALIEKLAVGKTTQAAIIRLLISEIIRASPFNEAAYLADYPDVAAAIAGGDWPDGHAHYAAAGYFEGRWAPPFTFSEDWYLAQNADVAEAVAAGALQSGEEHYHAAGMAEGRSPAAAATADVEAWHRAGNAAPEERQTATLERNPAVFERWRQLKTGAPEVTPALFPVGALSPRGDLILGRDGTAFLIGGPDSPLPQYGRDAAEVAARAADVAAHFSQRRRLLAQRGITYLQLVIPEKISVLAEEFPVEIATPTPLLASIEAHPDLASCLIPCTRLFRADRHRRQTFRPVDKHLAPYGAYRLAQEILSRLALPPLPDIAFDRPCVSTADMSDRFTGLLETFEEGNADFLPTPEKLSESRQTLGDVGKRQSWRCATARPLKLVVFGNSYFDFAERGQYCLSWWMTRLFAAYEFIWMPQLDLDLVDALRPDIVICQTAERFLHRLPAS